MNTSTFQKVMITALVIVLGLIIWRYIESQQPYNRIPLSRNNNIVNQSQFTFVDTTLSVALEVAEISGVSVIIKDLSQDIRSRFADDNAGIDLQAAIIGRHNQYILYVYRIDRMGAISVISHEVVHLMQYRSGRIDLLSDSKVLWEGDTLTTDIIYSIPYAQRPWEKEAFRGEPALSQKVERVLYGKNM